MSIEATASHGWPILLTIREQKRNGMERGGGGEIERERDREREREREREMLRRMF